MNRKILLYLISSQLLVSCFFSNKTTLPLEQDFISLVRSLETNTQIIKQENGYILITSPLKFYLDNDSFQKWYEHLSDIEIIKNNGSQDLSKMAKLASFDFKTDKQNLLIELFQMQEIFFVKLRLQKKDNENPKYLAGNISKEDAQKLLLNFNEFHSKKILLPLDFKKIDYIAQNARKNLDSGQASEVFECLHSFISDKTIYQGYIDPSVAYKYSIGQKINANLTGHFQITDKNNELLDIYMGKPEQLGIRVRFWAKGSGEIKEGNLPCLSKLRKVVD